MLHPVHGGSAIMHLTDFVSQTGIEEDTLRSSGLTGIDVSHDADVTSIFKMFVFSHCGKGFTSMIELEAEVGEGAVSLSHLVHIFFTFESAALIVESVNDFSCEFVSHSLAATFAGIANKILH